MLTSRSIRNGLAVLTVSLLAACGGGGDSSSSGVQPSSYWTMDSYSYTNGGQSAQSSATVGGKPVIVVVVSTATTTGGTDTTNGKFSGSSLAFSFAANGPGVYNLVPSQAALAAADAATMPMVVESTVGIAVTTGTTLFTAASGQVKVTQGSDGKYHFASVGVLPATKTVDTNGGVAGAPNSMALTVHDAY